MQNFYQKFTLLVFTYLTGSILFPGHVNVAPRHLTAEAETLLSASLIHEVSTYACILCCVKVYLPPLNVHLWFSAGYACSRI